MPLRALLYRRPSEPPAITIALDREVYLVRADNRAILQPMRAGRVVGEEWLVLDGLKPGDRVVVEGFQKFASGDVVDPIPWRSTRTTAGSPAADAQKSPAP